MPILPSGLPAAFTADPEINPWSMKVPSRRLIQSWFGVASFAT
jgi:hypothetical protein